MTDPLTVSTSTYHHGGLRAALVAAALDLLAEHGAEQLSLRAVARRAGVSAMAPYRHFPDKAALVSAVAARGFEGLRDALLAAEADAAPGDGLTSQAVAYVAYAVAHPALFRLMFGLKGRADPALAAAGESAYAVLTARVAADLPGEGVEARTLGCWSMVHGLASLFLDGQLAAGGAGPPDAVTRQVAAAMLEGRMDPRRHAV